MITENRRSPADIDVSRSESRLKVLLPWLIAGGAFFIYLATFNHWVTFSSLSNVARISGWTWQPEIWPFTQPQPAPLYWLLTYPFRWLPVSAIPVALNLFSVLLAVLVLALLGRSVMLLPHDRTHAQRLREKSEFSLLSTRSAWLPPALAVLVCGLQLTFWEHATAASQEMLNLLLFAYVIRCLLEFRIDCQQHWLSRAALLYGLGITNDWAFIGFFPVFIAAIVWIKGLSFFDMRFLGRMCLWGCLGLLFYLLLPLVQTMSKVTVVPFWTALRANLGGQKLLLSAVLNKQMLLHSDRPLWVLGIASLLPLLVMAINWPSYFGDTSRLGVGIASFSFHLVHGILLLFCVWIALDAPISPRFHVPEGFRPWLPMLTLYYLGALGIGYFCGYGLLVLGKKAERQRRSAPGQNPSERWVHLAGTVFLVLVGALLLCRNLPQIRATNGSALRDFAQLLTDSLPPGPAIVLSDDVHKLLLAQGWVTSRNRGSDYLFLDTSSLKWPDYQRFLTKHYRERWPIGPETAKRQSALDDGSVLRLISSLSETNVLYYLHPSFGYYFERFCAEPHGLVYKLRRYAQGQLLPPPPDPQVSSENESFWKRAESTTLKDIKPFLPKTQPGRATSKLDKLFTRMHLSSEPNRDISVLAGFCSRAMNFWGVEQQKQGNLREAASHFEESLEFNPDNLVASINLECNKELQAGRQPTTKLPKSIEDQFGKYRKWDQIMNANGPFDQPDFCLEQGRFFARAGLHHQAAQELDRAIALTHDNVPARLMLAQLYLLNQLPDQAVALVNEVHSFPPALSMNRSNQTDLLYIELSMHLAKGEVSAAEAAFRKAMARFPKDEELLATATHIFMNAGQFTNAMAAIDEQLEITPENPGLLVNKAYALMQFHDYEKALEYLNRALVTEPTHTLALFNRAVCHLQLNHLEEAQRSYEQLLKTYPTAYQLLYGLGEIAWRKKDSSAAIRYYELYLTNAPAAGEADFVRNRLAELKSGAH